MVFNVKKSPILLLLALLFALSPLPLIFIILFVDQNPVIYLPLAITLLLSSFSTTALFRSRFVVTDLEFKILFGWNTYRIPLDQIRYIRFTKNPLSAPAWTLRRLEIGFHRFDFILVSLPKDEPLFFQTLKERCPQAEIQGVDI